MVTASQIKHINERYVKRQLERIELNSNLGLKITDSNGGKTNFIGVNDTRTIDLLIDFLKQRKEVLS